MENKDGNIGMWVLILLALLIGIAGGAYVFTHPQAFSPGGAATTTPPVTVDAHGMREYSDSDFNFSFWYPSSWQIASTTGTDTKMFPGGTVVKTLQVGTPGGVIIYVVHSPMQTITDEPYDHASPIAQTKYFYADASKQWMVAYPEGTSFGALATTTANVSNTTLSGLIMLPSGRRFDTSIIPLRSTDFLVISDGGGNSATVLAKTVSLSGTPIDPAILSAALQTEADAYRTE